MSDQVNFQERSDHNLKLESYVEDAENYATRNGDPEGTNDTNSQHKNPFNYQKVAPTASKTNKVNPNKKYSRK